MTVNEPAPASAGDTAGPIRHGRLKARGGWAAALKLLVGIVAVASLGSASIVAIAAWDVASSVKPGIHLGHLPGHSSSPIADLNAIDGGVNLLLTGTDTRTGQGGAFSTKDQLAGSSGAGNNDVTMVMHIARDHKSAIVVSFPRDTIIPIPACPNPGGRAYPASRAAMINTTLARGGLPCTVLTIEKLTGLQIPFAALITMDGVVAMSNSVGGVTVCLATPVVDRYTNPPLNLAAGSQTLVGPQALSFLRSRHGVGDGSDLGRISNQQVFLSALVRKIKSAGVLNNPFELYPLAKAAVSNLQLSDTMTNPTTLVQIALALKAIDLTHVVFVQYPTETDPADPNRVIPLASAARILNSALVQDQPIALSGKPGKAAVLEPASPGAAPTPSAPAASAPTGSASTGSVSAAPNGTPVPSPTASSMTVTLPDTVSGQTAADQTCTTREGR